MSMEDYGVMGMGRPRIPIAAPVKIKSVFADVAEKTGVVYRELVGRDKTARAVCARRMVCKRLRDIGLGYSQIGRLLHRDHTTVHYLINGRGNRRDA